MISKNEVELKADEFGLNPADVERDYVFGWLLAGIYSSPLLKDKLVLKGGNCFRKAYFRHTRFSNDLDFSATASIDPRWLETQLNNVCDFVQENTGVLFVKDRNYVEEKTNSDQQRRIYEARIYFRDFYGNPLTITISVRLDITEHDRIFLPAQRRFLIHPYSDADKCAVEVTAQKLEELLASKLKCLLQRRHSFDLYDYVYSIFVNRDIEVNRTEIITTFLKKTIFERSPGVVRSLLLDLPFELFRGFWAKFLVCPKQGLIDFDLALDNFKKSIDELFGRFRPDHYGMVAFFPSHFRNLIMDAGSTLTLLEFVYDGHRRMVEPYALAFKTRKDGFGQEYFYAYDTTGGRTGQCGIKTFLHTKIQELKSTLISFEPRYPVELAKAGEFGGRTYFMGQRMAVFRSAVRRRVLSERRYIVECAYCGKRFPRKKYSVRLRRHMDTYGNMCAGRSGYMAY
jgi:predicted nucleotidyltransferase component of viral defense system